MPDSYFYWDAKYVWVLVLRGAGSGLPDWSWFASLEFRWCPGQQNQLFAAFLMTTNVRVEVMQDSLFLSVAKTAKIWKFSCWTVLKIIDVCLTFDPPNPPTNKPFIHAPCKRWRIYLFVDDNRKELHGNDSNTNKYTTNRSLFPFSKLCRCQVWCHNRKTKRVSKYYISVFTNALHSIYLVK